MRVILERGDKGHREFIDPSSSRAMERAISLAWFFNCKLILNEGFIFVDATQMNN